MLDDLTGVSTFDVMESIAAPFPIMAITELLAVPDTDRHRLHGWTVAVTAFDELPIDFGVLAAAGEAADEFLAYADDLVVRRRADPGDDLISALIAAEDDGERLSHDELLAMIVLLLVAGHDTTMSLISTGLWLLLRHPEAAEAVRCDPHAVPGAIEEILRFMGPLQVASGGGRWPAEPVELHGRTIEPGNASVSCSARRIAIPRSSRTRTGSTSPAATAVTWRSARDSTSASVPHWGDSKVRSSSPPRSVASPIWHSSTRTRGGDRPS